MAGVTAAEGAPRPAAPKLPPAPRAPAPVQTLAVLLRPVEFAERCRRRFGDTFRVHTSSPRARS